MNRLPKNIDDLDEFNKYQKAGFKYTIDDFMIDYGVKERKAETLLKNIDYIGVSQKLSKRVDGIKREKYYRSSDVFFQLVALGEVVFKYDMLQAKAMINVKNEVVYYHSNNSNEKRLVSVEIPPAVMFSSLFYGFYKILRESSSLREMAEFEGLEYTDTVKKNLSRKVKRVESIRIEIGGLVKYYLIDLNTDFELMNRILDKMREYKKGL